MAKQATELSLLKDRATLMGIKFHPSIGVKSLKEKLNAVLNSEEEVEEMVVQKPKPRFKQKSEATRKAESNTRLRKTANRLVRINLTCMNPNKKDWPGEILSISNRVIGTIKKFVPFNTEVGYHVPAAILRLVQERKYQAFKEIKLPNGQKQKRGHLVKEFAIEILDPLTPQELKDLAQRQAMGNRIED